MQSAGCKGEGSLKGVVGYQRQGTWTPTWEISCPHRREVILASSEEAVCTLWSTEYPDVIAANCRNWLWRINSEVGQAETVGALGCWAGGRREDPQLASEGHKVRKEM